MIKAYILLTLTMGQTQSVIDALKKLKNIESISVVTGSFDVVLKVSVETLDELYKVTYIDLSDTKGIKEITTFIVEKEIIPEED
ncbi:MAG TPA: Lrp/AsnC ligand binding domain-containing protein [Candidatus Deferrimicrobium sp.]|nr:Lrp/AsnC ligand binding domain-containing protein [Candidatus Deferrimicrobium sp.]